MGSFIPAARFGILTPCYDALCRMLGLGAALRDFEMALLPHDPAAVLEVGCGTGELTVRLTTSLRSRVTAMDVDPEILALAERKLRRASAPASLAVARAEALPFSDSSFDLVIASLVVHHLRTEEKRAAFREWRRVLRRNGIAVLIDFGPPATRLGRALTSPLRWNLLEESGDHFAGRIPSLLAEAHFRVEELGCFRGVVRAWQARRA